MLGIYAEGDSVVIILPFEFEEYSIVLSAGPRLHLSMLKERDPQKLIMG